MFRRLRSLLGRLAWFGGGRTGRGDDSDRLGPRSEQIARAFLERAGFHVIEANYRCPLGELDLVARGEGKLVFVEVKARRVSSPLPRGEGAGVRGPLTPLPLGEGAGVRVSGASGRPESRPRPEDAVNRTKQKKIGRAAKYFCRARKMTDTPARFDVIAVDWPGDGGEPVIRHHKAAFRPDV